MPSEVSIRVRATNEANAALRDAARDTRLLNASVQDLQGSMRTYDERARSARENMGRLDNVVRQHRDSLRQLAGEYANASDASQRLDIGKQIDKIQADIQRAMRTRQIHLDDLIEVSEDHNIASRLLRDLEGGSGGGLGAKLSALGSKVGPLLGNNIGVTAGAAAAPILIGVLGTALSAGAGALGIGAGIALAIKSDTALQQAGKDLGKDFMGQITQSAHTAFAGPIANEIKSLGNFGDEIADQWGKAFEGLAPSLEPFLNSIAGTVTDLSGVFADIASNSGPALDALGDSLSTIGGSLGDLLKNITDEVDQNASSFEVLTAVLTGTIDAISLTVSGLQLLAAPLVAVWKTITSVGEGIGWLAVQMGLAEEPTAMMRAVTVSASDAMTTAAGAANAETDALKGLADELKAQTDPAFALIDAQKGLSEAQTAYNKAVKKGGKDSAEAKDALTDLAKAAITVEGAAEKAAGTFNGKVSPSLRATLRAAGLTDAQIDGVAKSFKDAKAAGDAFSGKYKAEVGQHGAEAAKRAISQAAAAARAYAGQYVAALAVKISRIDAGHDGPQAGNKATGGTVGTAATGATSSGMTWVGEQGPELVSLPPGTRVQSNVDSTRVLPNGTTGYSMEDITNMYRARTGRDRRDQFDRGSQRSTSINVNIGRHTLAEIVVPALQEYIGSRAGGNVNVLSGS